MNAMFWIATAFFGMLLLAVIGIYWWRSAPKGAFKLSYVIGALWVLLPIVGLYLLFTAAAAHVQPPQPQSAVRKPLDPQDYLAGVEKRFKDASQAYVIVDAVTIRYNPARDGRLICTGMLTLGKASAKLVEKNEPLEGRSRQGGFIYASRVTQGDYPLTIAGSDLAKDSPLTQDYEGLCWSISSAAMVQTTEDVLVKSKRMYQLAQRKLYGIEGQHDQVMIGWYGNNPPDRTYSIELTHFKAIPHQRGNKRGEPSMQWKLTSWPPGQPLQLPAIPTSWRGQRIFPLVHIVFVPKDGRPFTQPFQTLLVVNGRDVWFDAPVITVDAKAFSVANDDLSVGIVPLIANAEIHVVVEPRIVP